MAETNLGAGDIHTTGGVIKVRETSPFPSFKGSLSVDATFRLWSAEVRLSNVFCRTRGISCGVEGSCLGHCLLSSALLSAKLILHCFLTCMSGNC
jgi:hypothetical protein